MKTLFLVLLFGCLNLLFSCKKEFTVNSSITSKTFSLATSSGNVYTSNENLPIGLSDFNACDNNVRYWATGTFYVTIILNIKGSFVTLKKHVAYSNFKGGDDNGNTLVVTGNQSFDEVYNFSLEGRDYYTLKSVIKFAVHSSNGGDFNYISTLSTIIDSDGTVKSSVYDQELECK